MYATYSFRFETFHELEIQLFSSVVSWPQYLATDLEVPGSIPVATRYSER
jgi:hypothetical protein